MKKICGITTKPVTIKSFMLGNLNYLTYNDYESYVISGDDGKTLNMSNLENVKFIPVDIKHGNVSPLEVLKTTWKLYKLFRKHRFDVIQYATSNAALYASFAGWLARIPVRIYCQWGISYTDYKGLPYWFYKTAEKVTCLFSTSVQPDSPSNLKFSISENLYSPSKGYVLLNGSATGVNLVRFNHSRKDEWKQQILLKYSIPNDAFIFGFIGRIVPEKGINELLEAFISLPNNNAYLFIVGPQEEEIRLNQELLTKAKKHTRIIFTGSVSDAEKYHATFTFHVLPSYREGFGMTVVEAAAMGTPSIISNINGPTDFIVDNFNGYICDVKSVASLSESLNKALSVETSEIIRLSENAYNLVKEKFDSEVFKKEFLNNRNELLIKAKR